MSANRFIVVEPSIKSAGGHYLQYALYVLRAASEQGYNPVLACHKDFPVEPIENISTFAVFTDTFWHRYEMAGRSKSRVSSIVGNINRLYGGLKRRWKVAWYFSRAYSFLGIRIGPFFSKQPIRDFMWRIYEITAWLRMPIVNWYNRLGSPPDRFLIESKRAISRMAADMQVLHEKVAFKKGDQILLATVSGAEIEAVLDAIERNPQLNEATWHLVFRRNLRASPSKAFGKDVDVELVRQNLNRLQRSKANVHVYTDTDALTAEYNAVAKLGPQDPDEKPVDFKTLPIPHIVRPTVTPSDSEPYIITYLGDARSEKGFQHLGPVVEALESRLLKTKRARFRFQANFSTGSGDPDCAYTRRELELYPEDQVELILQPQSEEDYRNCISSAHLVLIPYDHNNYSERSSGIFAECVGMEVPVIVPAGTWMSRQICLNNYERLKVEFDRFVDKSFSPGFVPEPLNQGILNPLENRWFAEWGQACFGIFLQVPKNSAQAIFKFTLTNRWYTRLTIDHRDREGVLLKREDKLLEVADPQVPTQTFTLSDLPDGVANIYVHAANYSITDIVSKDAVGVAFISAKDRLSPFGAGEIYCDWNEIPELVLKVVGHYPSYKASLKDFAKSWRDFHSGPGFIRELNIS